MSSEWSFLQDIPLDPTMEGVRLDVRTVLDRYDGLPMFFTSEVGERLLLCYICEMSEEENLNRFVVSVINPTVEEALVRGDMLMYDSLDQEQVWLVEEGFESGLIDRAYAAESLRSLPEDILPNPHVTLYALHSK